MKLSTRARYGTRALLDLAIHQDEAPIALKDVAPAAADFSTVFGAFDHSAHNSWYIAKRPRS